MPDDDVIKVPNENILMGSCSNCGHPIWTKDAVMEENVFNRAVYRCIKCKTLMSDDEIIPF